MRHLTTIAALALGLLLIAAPAQADTILDFRGNTGNASSGVSYSNGDLRGLISSAGVTNAARTTGLGDWYQNSQAGNGGVDFSVGALSFTGTAWQRDSATDTTRDQIYLYGDTWGNNGGLGAVDLGQSYAGQPQDNIWDFESVQLHFTSGPVTIGAATFYNGGHSTSFATGAAIWVRVDNASTWSVFNVGSLGHSFDLNLTGSTFEFFNPNTGAATYDNQRFYVSTLTVNPVPEPTSMALFALGAGGLALARRRRRRIA